MPRKILNYLRQNILALLALFVALAGTSYAAISLPSNSVGTKQIRKHAVTSSKLAKHSVKASSLDPKSNAGHIADWAIVSASGEVVSSNRPATVTTPNPTSGFYRVSWHRPIPQTCVAIANANSLGWVTAQTLGPTDSGRSTNFIVQTTDAAARHGAPENFSILVICP